MDAKTKQQFTTIRIQAELFNLDNGSYHGPQVDGFYDNDINNCARGSSINSRVGSIFENGTVINRIMDETYTRIGGRIFCAFGDIQNDSWAVALQLLDTPEGYTGMCVDSSGRIDYVDFPFSGSSGNYPIGGGSNPAACPFL